MRGARRATCDVLGRLIGNAVPVKLGSAIGKSLVRYVEAWLERQERAA